jgi:hypothetical protein
VAATRTRSKGTRPLSNEERDPRQGMVWKNTSPSGHSHFAGKIHFSRSKKVVTRTSVGSWCCHIVA